MVVFIKISNCNIITRRSNKKRTGYKSHYKNTEHREKSFLIKNYYSFYYIQHTFVICPPSNQEAFLYEK